MKFSAPPILHSTIDLAKKKKSPERLFPLCLFLTLLFRKRDKGLGNVEERLTEPATTILLTGVHVITLDSAKAAND